MWTVKLEADVDRSDQGGLVATATCIPVILLIDLFGASSRTGSFHRPLIGNPSGGVALCHEPIALRYRRACIRWQLGEYGKAHCPRVRPYAPLTWRSYINITVRAPRAPAQAQWRAYTSVEGLALPLHGVDAPSSEGARHARNSTGAHA